MEKSFLTVGKKKNKFDTSDINIWLLGAKKGLSHTRALYHHRYFAQSRKYIPQFVCLSKYGSIIHL